MEKTNLSQWGRFVFTHRWERSLAFLTLLYALHLSTAAEATTVYTRVVKNVQNSETLDYDKVAVKDFTPYFHVWETWSDDEKGNQSQDLQKGFGNDKVAPSTSSVSNADGSTTTWSSYKLPDKKAGHSYNIIVALYNADGKCVWQTQDLGDLANAKEDIYLEVEYMPYNTKEDGSGTDMSRFAFHEMNQWQAKGYDLRYYVCDEQGNKLGQFQIVRNQEAFYDESDKSNPVTRIIGHSINSSIWNCGISATNLAENKKFYISGGYYDAKNNYQEKYQYRPYTADYDFANASGFFNALNGYSVYNNCCIVDGTDDARATYFYNSSSTNSGNSNATDVSYTFYLNTSVLSNSYSETNQNNNNDYSKNQKISVWRTIDYGNKSIAMQRNSSLATDDNGYNLLINTVKLRPEDGYENQEGSTGIWDMTDKSKVMTRLDFTDSKNSDFKKTLLDNGAYEEGDVVYYYRVPRPQAAFETLFMAFCPTTVLNNWLELQSAYNNSSLTGADKELLDPWNKVIRPQVQEGKCAMGMIGGVFVPQHNAMQALTPNIANSNYAQFDVFLNVTRSMYVLSPVNSYDLTGPAVRYYNTSSHSFEESRSGDMWGNGQFQYHYTAMAYNPTENCWQYTGMFYKSINRNEDGTVNNTEGGFRIRTNQLYSTNYHEEPYWFSSQNANETKENIICHQNQTYAEYVASQSASQTQCITTRPMSAVAEWRTTDANGNVMHDPNGPDTYYYNHVVTCETGKPLWTAVKNTTSTHGSNDGLNDWNVGKDEEQQRININFDLDDGFYTIKFYPQGDATGKPYYTLQEAKDPGTVIPVPVEEYRYIRTYSASKNYAIPSGMDVYTAVKVDADNSNIYLKKINSLGYLPKYTGLIIAYKTDISTGNTDGLTFSSSDGETQYKDISNHYPKLSLTEYKGSTDQQSTYLEGNLLLPTTIVGGTVGSIPTTVFENNATSVNVKARNYNFTLLKTYKDDTSRDNSNVLACELAFRRVRTYTTADGLTEKEVKLYNTPTADRAYLQLPAQIYGGTRYGNVNSDGFGEEKLNVDPKAKLFQLDVNFDDSAATSITTLPQSSTQMPDNRIFNLQGMEVKAPTHKGIYIQNGKKFVIR